MNTSDTQQPTAHEAVPPNQVESGLVRMWHDRIKSEHPTSDPDYWPSSLKAQYMEAEILELRAALAASKKDQVPHAVPDGVWEALQRMIEDGLTKGDASRDDARSVARWRGRFVPSREGSANQTSRSQALTCIPLDDSKSLRLKEVYEGSNGTAWFLVAEDGENIRQLDQHEEGFLIAALRASSQWGEPAAIVKWQLGGITSHIVGDVQHGDVLYKRAREERP